jgi:hypothetical protein
MLVDKAAAKRAEEQRGLAARQRLYKPRLRGLSLGRCLKNAGIYRGKYM